MVFVLHSRLKTMYIEFMHLISMCNQMVTSEIGYYSHQGFLQTMVKFSMLRNSKPLEF